ncbi:MAG: hypothetical protein MUE84_10190 [Hyphomonas sp.]|nr:hypothetical protein [Hyphomonas sp.]
MKSILALAALAVAALPAFAATTTVEFASVEGDTLVAVFSDDGTVSFNGGAPVAYTMDEASKTICSSVNGTDNCATFETWGNEVGHATPYTTSLGSSGTATVTAKSE